ncbi:MAG: 16S rRNA (guanine(966)-N(2))-methyltransferase RsmD [Candidatus Omnitrophota bacterium]|jgi:16S rRNA (guanine(966)-N(2))-methyltransferase RsmD|nr:MAG: 16S rRNA (guanine(966)-N(2))-methyltransferase RsmD [Candidatus Omnitrophota bacterium]
MMRITSGANRGRSLKVPKGIRPTQEKVRKAVFDILADVEGLSFLELFAGSGAVSFEAASRGAGPLTIVESNAGCVKAIKGNMEALGVKDARVLAKDIVSAIIALQNNGNKFDIIFLDPPYYKDLAKKTLQTLSAYDILAPNGFIIIQHFKKDSLIIPQDKFKIVKQSTYGDTILTFCRRIAE